MQWLHDKEIYYWGDIDRDGFAILSRVRGYFPHIKSLLMDDVTIDMFRAYAIQENESKRNTNRLENLTNEESIIYNNLCSEIYGERFRLEQERIDFKYVLKSISQIM